MPSPSGANQDDLAPGERASSVHSPQVRLASPADADRLAEINVLTWQQAYAGIVPAAYLEALDVEWSRDRWLARLASPGHRVNLLAEIDGQIAAYAIAGTYRVQHDATPENTTGWGELYALYTHPDLQGRGAGQAVHDAALTELSGRGHPLAAVWVLRDNLSGLRWYGRRGWKPDGVASTWLGAGVPLEEIRLTRSANGSFSDRSSRLGR